MRIFEKLNELGREIIKSATIPEDNKLTIYWIYKKKDIKGGILIERFNYNNKNDVALMDRISSFFDSKVEVEWFRSNPDQYDKKDGVFLAWIPKHIMFQPVIIRPLWIGVRIGEGFVNEDRELDQISFNSNHLDKKNLDKLFREQRKLEEKNQF